MSVVVKRPLEHDLYAILHVLIRSGDVISLAEQGVFNDNSHLL
jgi:hypothetical protein